MRTLILSTLIFVTLSIISLAQNWFPLEVGNKSMSRLSYNYMGAQIVIFYYTEVNADTIIDGQKYYFIKYYENSSYLTTLCLRYDNENQKGYDRYDENILAVFCQL